MNKRAKEELKNLSVDELTAKVEELRRDLFSTRLHSATTPIKDNTSFKKLRRAIACALTFLHQKKEGISHGTK